MLAASVLLAGCGGGADGPAPAPVPAPAPSPTPAPPPAPAPAPKLLEFVAGDTTSVWFTLRPTAILDGKGVLARFGAIRGLAADATGNLYAADHASVRKIAADGTVTTLAGRSEAGTADGTGSAAQFANVRGIATGPGGTIYVSDDVGIRKVTPAGVVTTFVYAKPPSNCFGLATCPPPPPTPPGPVRLNRAAALTADPAGNLYVVDSIEPATEAGPLYQVRKVAPDGTVSDVPGGAFGRGPYTDSGAVLAGPIAADGAGNLYVGMTRAFTMCAPLPCRFPVQSGYIVKIAPGGNATLHSGSDQAAAGAADGPASNARYVILGSLQSRPDGTLYATDPLNHAVRRIAPDGSVTTVLGSLAAAGGEGGVDLGPVPGRLRFPHGLALAPAGALFTTAGYTEPLSIGGAELFVSFVNIGVLKATLD
jgi:hypothetical protein